MAEQATEEVNTSIETQLVVFDLATEIYGADSGEVRELIRMQSSTSVPGPPDVLEGGITLRGRVALLGDLSCAVLEPRVRYR